mgnify:CR=1 FL=1
MKLLLTLQKVNSDKLFVIDLFPYELKYNVACSCNSVAKLLFSFKRFMTLISEPSLPKDLSPSVKVRMSTSEVIDPSYQN